LATFVSASAMTKYLDEVRAPRDWRAALYSGRGESPGRWTGAGAETLRLGVGLTTTVSWR
jgi:hypothetical protein